VSPFPQDVIQAAIASRRKWGVPASVTLAQWSVESNFGRAMPPGSNNPFGIKALPGQPSVTARTSENVKGKVIYIEAKFRAFVSLSDAFDQHGRLLATAPVYAKAMALKNNPNAFAAALTGIYASNPHYGIELQGRMKQYNLYQYDNQ
jgi:flagellum-specific peptidoglycan hydrolase FlgJ